MKAGEQEESRKVRPVLRLMAVLLGLYFLAASVFIIAKTFHNWEVALLATNWEEALLVISGFVIGPFFIHVGITGTNYGWPSELNDDEAIDK